MSRSVKVSNSMAAKVGIFMPCYNMGKYLDSGLETVYSQTYEDFTVIIADDASPEQSTRNKLAKVNRPRLQVFFEKKNLGLIKISNRYMEKLDAEYIMLLSPDDKLHPDFLKEHVAYLDSHPDVHAACAWLQEFGDGTQLVKYYDKKCRLPEMLVDNNYSGAAVIRKSAWLAAGKYDPHKDFYPNLDYELWLAMLDKGFVLGTIPKPLFYWRVVKDSLSHRMGADQMLVFRKALLKKYSHLYRQHSDYVMNRYLEIFSEFENYYAVSTEGHDWLDQQYKNLTKENAELHEQLKEHAENSIRVPYIGSAAHKTIRHLKRPKD